MIPFHSVYVATLFSQATSALVLVLLSASDRRVRGIPALATACVLHTIAISLMPLWAGGDRWVPEAISAGLLPTIFFLFHLGLTALVKPGTRLPRGFSVAIGAIVGGGVLLAPWHPLLSIQIERMVAIALMFWTATVLLRHKAAFLRLEARVTGVLLLAIAGVFLVRVPLESTLPVTPFLLSLRELTMAQITVLAFSFLALYLGESKRRLHFETRVDPLTGLPNRRAMEEHAAAFVRSALRTGKPLCLVMMDLDAFKLLNDTWGHAVGDRALRAVGKVLLSASVNGNTVVARLSGEEFAMLLPEHTVDAAKGTAELLRTAIATTHVQEGIRHVNFTMSLGVAALHSGETQWNDMLHRADMALYRAKREGRNRVALCEHLATHPASSERHDRRFREKNQQVPAEQVEAQ